MSRISRWLAVTCIAAATETPLRAVEPAREGGPPVTLELVRAEIGDALRMLAKQGGLNLVIGPDVKADVSVSLREVPVRLALRALAEGNGFRCTEADGIIAVTKPPVGAAGAGPEAPLMTRVLRPRCVNATLLRDALQPALSQWGKLTVLSEDSREGYGLGTFENNGGSNGSAPQGTSFRSASRSDFTVNNNNPPAGSPMPHSGNSDGMNASVHNSQILIVTDIESKVQQISRLVTELDVPPRQVLIEARIVEMTVELQKQLGIDWNVEAFANGPILNHKFPLFKQADFANGSATIKTDTRGMALGVVDFSAFSATLKANQDDTGMRLLANPRMLIYNNHAASILVGEKYPLLTSTITDQGTTTESFDSYIPVGVQLSVTPTILADGRVSLIVHPATSALGDDVVGTTGLRVARIQTRELDTRVVMRDGDTIVLGGLISDRKTNSVHKVPGLGDIPILDIFTRQEKPKIDRVDLLVFLSIFVEGATDMSENDRAVYDQYKPRFRHSEPLKNVKLHFDFPGTQFHEQPADLTGDTRDDKQSAAPESNRAAAAKEATP